MKRFLTVVIGLAAALLCLTQADWTEARTPAESNLQPVLPLKIRSHLNRHYNGWRLTANARGCAAEFKRAVATGDFDGDRKRDYVLKFVSGRKGYVMAFLERENGYEAHVLHDMSLAEINRTALSVFRKGERVPVGESEDQSSDQRLRNDAPFDGPCESDAGGVHIYQNGKFN